jgi:hypothetical protein
MATIVMQLDGNESCGVGTDRHTAPSNYDRRDAGALLTRGLSRFDFHESPYTIEITDNIYRCQDSS